MVVFAEVTGHELFYLAPGGAAAHKDRGRAGIVYPTDYGIDIVVRSPDHDGVPADGYGKPEPVPVVPPAVEELLLLAPSGPASEVLKGIGCAGIGTIVIVSFSTDNDGVPADAYGVPESIAHCPVAGEELLLLGPGAAAAHKDIGRARIIAVVIVPPSTDDDVVPADAYGAPEAV